MTARVKIFIDDITKPWGTERAVINLANNLASHGYNVEIASSYSSSGEAAFPIDSKVRINHLGVPNLKSKNSIITTLKGLQRLRASFISVLDAQPSTLIGTNTVINSLLASIKLVRNRNIDKVIGCEHLPFDFGTRFTFKLREIFYKYLDHVVLLTRRDAEKYQHLNLSNIRVIPNEAPETMVELVNSTREKTLISVGRLTDQKGFDILIEDMAPVLRKFDDWILEIYGEGELRPLLSEMIARLDMEDRIFLRGPVGNLQQKYQSSSIYLMTSRYEGFGMVLVEAQSNALPVVVYDCDSGPSEIVDDGQNGYLIPMGNSDEFRRRVEELILNQEKRELMGRAAAESVQRFSSEKIFLKWRALLEGGKDE